MFNTPSWLTNYPRLTKRILVVAFILGVAILNAPSPVEAIPLIVQQGNCNQGFQQLPSSFIYGSPIGTPMPVNPISGAPNFGNNSYRNCNFGYPVPLGGTIENSILINPTVINSQVYGSVLVNPTVVNQPVYGGPYYRRLPNIYNYPIRSQIQIGF